MSDKKSTVKNQPLVNAMKLHKIDETQLAKQIGVVPSAVSKWVTGGDIRATNYISLARLMGRIACIGFSTKAIARGEELMSYLDATPSITLDKPTKKAKPVDIQTKRTKLMLFHEEGDQVVCVNPSPGNIPSNGSTIMLGLTKGKKYVVLDTHLPGFIKIENDTGDRAYYLETRFRSVDLVEQMAFPVTADNPVKSALVDRINNAIDELIAIKQELEQTP